MNAFGIHPFAPTPSQAEAAANTPTAAPSATSETFQDSFRYCSAIGTIDQADAAGYLSRI